MSKNKKVIIAGVGVMGASVAQMYAEAGWDTCCWARSEKSFDKTKELIKTNQATLVREGFITQEKSEKVKALITFDTDKSCFADPAVDVVFETIVEDLAIKQDFFKEVAAMAPKTCLFATNTSGLSITDICSKMDEGADRFMGQHWLNPPFLIPICELVVHEKTSKETVERMNAIILELKKHPVVVKEIPGFLINRLQFSIMREALYLIDKGICNIEDVDAALRYGLGPRWSVLGPMRTADFGGLDTFNRIATYLFPQLSKDDEVKDPLRSRAAAEEYGLKSKKGFYDYSDGKDVEMFKYRDEMLLRLAKVLYQ